MEVGVHQLCESVFDAVWVFFLSTSPLVKQKQGKARSIIEGEYVNMMNKFPVYTAIFPVSRCGKKEEGPLNHKVINCAIWCSTIDKAEKHTEKVFF